MFTSPEFERRRRLLVLILLSLLNIEALFCIGFWVKRAHLLNKFTT